VLDRPQRQAARLAPAARALSGRWFDTVSLTLLGELRRRAPHAIDWAAMGNIVPLIEAFEAVKDGRPVRRH